MGQAKHIEIEESSKGFIAPKDKHVCKNHFSDDVIIDFIDKHQEEGICSYCKLRDQDGYVIKLDTLLVFLISGIKYFYGNPNDECVGYDSSEGGWQGAKVFDTFDLLQNEVWLEIDNKVLFNDIASSFTDYEWCQKDPYSLPEHHELSYDWKRFCDTVKHKIRYSFFASKTFDVDNKVFSQILHEIAAGVHSLNLISKITPTTKLYRCRQHKENENPSSFGELSSPPIKFANLPNRMSPAGISMFYGAYDKETAIIEIYEKKENKEKPIVTTGEFLVKENLYVVDFTNLPEIPSIFDEKHRKDYYKIIFFHSFVSDLSKEISKDNQIHIEYVPTQIMTEYFRYVFPEYSQIELDGIIYKSSKNAKGKCCVLFLDNKESEKYLELRKVEKIKMPSCLQGLIRHWGLRVYACFALACKLSARVIS